MQYEVSKSRSSTLAPLPAISPATHRIPRLLPDVCMVFDCSTEGENVCEAPDTCPVLSATPKSPICHTQGPPVRRLRPGVSKSSRPSPDTRHTPLNCSRSSHSALLDATRQLPIVHVLTSWPFPSDVSGALIYDFRSKDATSASLSACVRSGCPSVNSTLASLRSIVDHQAQFHS